MELTIEELRKLCDAGAIRWTAHILMRLQERDIEPSDIIHCVSTGRIIEAYPTDFPYPSCLVLGATVAGKALHAVIGVGKGAAWLVTAYHPDPAEWNDDFSVRKEHKS